MTSCAGLGPQNREINFDYFNSKIVDLPLIIIININDLVIYTLFYKQHFNSNHESRIFSKNEETTNP